MSKLQFKMRIRLDRCSLVFMEDEQPGVIATQVVTFDIPKEGQEWMLAATLNDIKVEFIDQNIKVDIEELK